MGPFGWPWVGPFGRRGAGRQATSRAGIVNCRYACRVPTAARSNTAHALASPAAPPVRRVLVVGIVALALMMMSIDSTIVATALHALQTGLDTSIIWAGWTLTAYSFGFVLMLPISGRLSERFGRRRVFMGSVAVFTLASLGCGLAKDIHVLIALRVLQAGVVRGSRLRLRASSWTTLATLAIARSACSAAFSRSAQ